MASTPIKEKSVTLSLEAADMTTPPKALTPFDTPSTSAVATPAEKVIELRRDSAPSTPHSLRNHNENPFDTDIEAMITTTRSGEPLSYKKSTAPIDKKDCPTVWPSTQHWKQKAKTAKKTRQSCNCLADLSKRNRIIVKILIILLIVGIGLGVGFGISKSLNAPIWGSNDNNK